MTSDDDLRACVTLPVGLRGLSAATLCTLAAAEPPGRLRELNATVAGELRSAGLLRWGRLTRAGQRAAFAARRWLTATTEGRAFALRVEERVYAHLEEIAGR